jgi:hypothetical protein
MTGSSPGPSLTINAIASTLSPFRRAEYEVKNADTLFMDTGTSTRDAR